MTSVVDARDVDHAAETLAFSVPCDNDVTDGWCSGEDPCARCVVLGLLRQARRFDAAEVPF